MDASSTHDRRTGLVLNAEILAADLGAAPTSGQPSIDGLVRKTGWIVVEAGLTASSSDTVCLTPTLVICPVVLPGQGGAGGDTVQHGTDDQDDADRHDGGPRPRAAGLGRPGLERSCRRPPASTATLALLILNERKPG